jgi:glycosyltransferase involved in cell wall biosynthesis
MNHASWATRSILDEDGFDLVHAHVPAALAAARLLDGVPVVYTLHHERVDNLSSYYQSFPEVYFVAISENQRRREAPMPRMEVIRHGVDPSPYQWVERPRDRDYVCFLGRLARVKGVHVAIDVAASARLPIRLAGSVHPEDEVWARRALRRRLAAPHVTTLGPIGLARKVGLLRDARALLAPIAWDEPFGLALVEAMLSGCPVVAFERGSVPELVEPGVTGFIARSAAHMAEIIRPGGVLEDFDRRRCRERAIERFSHRRMVRDYERLYERILSRRPAIGDREQRSRLHVA